MRGDDPTFPTPQPSAAPAVRFLPGAIVAERFRIVALLGKGGMGDVWRAEDTKLGQAVALKFLPSAVAHDRTRLALLLDEVRHARQVSHPNVCRVWDVHESDGQQFIAMEYVDGETLESLIRRIGRLPEELGVRIARELCAGLAAVHDQGLLHRDLKPSNVMLDGRGRVRITDFGVAALAGSAPEMSGTPAYMAPEQRAGGAASVKSDLYSLGLVLFEVFTGRKAADSATDTATNALDPAIQQAILACLAPVPAARPASATAVARALPGFRFADNETPSPEMVAAAGGTSGFAPWQAVLVALACVAGLAGALVLAERRLPFGPDTRSYGALRDRAQELARTLGPVNGGDDVQDGFSLFPAGDSIFYWYRRSPRLILRPVVDDGQRATLFTSPPPTVPGEKAFRYSLNGTLEEYRALPIAGGDSSGYAPFFKASDLSGAMRSPVPPVAMISLPSDAESAWIAGGQRVEGRSHRGQVVAFSVGEPDPPLTLTRGEARAGLFGPILSLAIFFLSLGFAMRNLRLGRADVRGALRCAFVTSVSGWLGFGPLSRAYVNPLGGFWFVGTAVTAFYALLTACGYLALEPYVRRRHPEWLTSWARLLEGRFLDPRVGRDLLIGIVAGLALGILGGLQPTGPVHGDFQSALIGGWLAVGFILRGVGSSALAFGVLLVLVLLQAVTRRAWLGWVLWAPLAVSLFTFSLTAASFALALVSTVVAASTIRFAGLWAFLVAAFVSGRIAGEYLTTHLDSAYAGTTIAVLLTVGALLAWGLLASTRSARA